MKDQGRPGSQTEEQTPKSPGGTDPQQRAQIGASGRSPLVLARRLRETLDNMLEGCQIIGYDWRYLYVNDAAAAPGRTTKERLLGKTIMEAYGGIENTEMFSPPRKC